MSKEERVEESKQTTSAVKTALWRSKFPGLSGDYLSQSLVTTKEADDADEYCKTEYPLAPRHMSVRAGWFAKKSQELLREGEYDCIVSFGSGFSLLTLVIMMGLPKDIVDKIIVLDTDLEVIVGERIRRIDAHAAISKCLQKYTNMVTQVLDLEEACKSGKSISDCLPKIKGKKPLFILEGLIYFLSLGCKDWLLRQMKDKTQFFISAVIMDFWPHNAAETSQLFRDKVLPFFAKETTAESVQQLMTDEQRDLLIVDAQRAQIMALSDAENYLEPPESVFDKKPQDDYIPAHFLASKL